MDADRRHSDPVALETSQLRIAQHQALKSTIRAKDEKIRGLEMEIEYLKSLLRFHIRKNPRTVLKEPVPARLRLR